MPRRRHLHIDEIALSYSHESFLHEGPNSAVEHWLVSADVHDGSGPVQHVGDIDIVIVDSYHTRNPFDLLDAAHGDLSTIGGEVFDVQHGGLAEDFENLLDVGYGGRIMLVNQAVLASSWRGHGLGPLLVAQAMKRLSGGVLAATCYPAPIGGKGNIEVVTAKLVKVWSQIGFEHFRNGVYYLDFALKTFDDAFTKLNDRFGVEYR